MTLLVLQRQFLIAPFDLQAANHFARIWQSRSTRQTVENLKSQGVTNREIKADSMIVATAIAAGSSKIYSHDPNLKKFAEGHIEVEEIPDTPQQLGLL